MIHNPAVATDHVGMITWEFIAIGAVFGLAGSVKGVTGMGLPTVAISLLGLWMPLGQAAALLVWPSLLTNLAQCRGRDALRLLRLLWPMGLLLVAAAVVTPPLPATGASGRGILGGVLLAYGLWGLVRPALPDLSRRPWFWGIAAGALTGAVTAWTGVFVMPLVPYLQALKLDKEALVQALGMSFTVATLALAWRLHGLAAAGAWQWPSVWALFAALTGFWCGTRLRARLNGRAFQRGVFLSFVLLGAVNLWWR